MNEPVDLELSLRRRDDLRYKVDLVIRMSGSEADVNPLGQQVVMVQFDLVTLRTLALDPDSYGRVLSNMLFQDPSLTSAFATALGVGQSQHRPVRLRLMISPDASELHALRWETLRDPLTDRPLAVGEQIMLSRGLASADWRPVMLRVKSRLRALVVVASPTGLEMYGLSPLDIQTERAQALVALQDVVTTVLSEPGQATLDTIIAQLRRQVDILYIVAHGKLVDSEPRLFLDNGRGKPAIVTGADLAARIIELPNRPQLIVLASCESASDGNEEMLTALGPKLAVAGIPAVIAMQGRISISTHRTFAPKFFQELQRDGRIDRALAVARRSVTDQPDWWVPALFTRLRSGRIWYEPGFDEDNFQGWPALLSSVRRGRCTPILGPGLLEPITGSTRDLAERLAAKHNFPLAPFARDDLPQVAQYLAVDQAPDFMRDAVERELLRAVRDRAPDLEPTASQPLSLKELLKQAGALRRAVDPDESHQVLASLPLPIYLTANPDPLLAEALRAAGRQPNVVICPWHLEEQHVEDREINAPDVEAPLVYHLLGHLDEPDSLVISEDDYFRFLIGVKSNDPLIPVEVQHALADTALLFLGFHFDDWSFRALLQSMLHLSGGKRRGKYAHVAVQIDPQEGVMMNPQAARKYLKEYLGIAAAQTTKGKLSVYWGSPEDFIRELRIQWLAAERDEAGL